MFKGKKSRKKIKKPQSKSRLRLFRRLLLLAPAALALWGLGILSNKFITSPHFSLEQIETVSLEGETILLDLERYGIRPGINIFFRKPLTFLAREIASDHPEFEEVTVERHLPDRLLVGVKKRKPLAQIRVDWPGKDKYFLIDGKGVIFSEREGIPHPNLPIIFGIPLKVKQVKLGEKQSSERIDEARLILKEFAASPLREEYEVRELDLRNLQNILISLGDLEVKLARGDYGEKIKLLEKILAELKKSASPDRYIDLRFEGGVPVSSR